MGEPVVIFIATKKEVNAKSPDDETSAPVSVGFPQFMKLPIELRFRIWEALSPNPKHTGRVLSMNIPVIAPDDNSKPYPSPGDLLPLQTELARLMLSIHRESREIGLKLYPHSFSITDGKYCVRFHKDRDIIKLHLESYGFEAAKAPYARTFCDGVVNLALPPCMGGYNGDGALDTLWFDLYLIGHFPNVKNVFTYDYSHPIEPACGKEKWIETDHTNWFTMSMPGFPHDRIDNLDLIYCWHKTGAQCTSNEACRPLHDWRLCRPLTPEDCIYWEGPDVPSPHEHLRERLATINKWPLKVCCVPKTLEPRDGRIKVVDAGPGSSGLEIEGDPGLTPIWEEYEDGEAPEMMDCGHGFFDFFGAIPGERFDNNPPGGGSSDGGDNIGGAGDGQNSHDDGSNG